MHLIPPLNSMSIESSIMGNTVEHSPLDSIKPAAMSSLYHLVKQKSKYVDTLKTNGIKNEYDREAVEYMFPTSMDRGSVSCILNATTLSWLDMEKQLLSAHLHDLKESITTDKIASMFSATSSEVKPIDWLLKGLIENNSINLLFGATGHGKSFVIIDMAMHLLNGMDWNGHKAKLKPIVLYIAGEGKAGINLRVNAVVKGKGLSDKDFYVSNTSIDMLNDESVENLIEIVDSIKNRPVWCIIDTLNRNFTGDENSSKDTAALYRNIDRLREVGATFTIVHHTGHSAQDRSRGSSSLRGAMDGELKVSMDDAGIITVENTKAKNVAKANSLNFKSNTFVFGQDEDGDDVSSLYLTPLLPGFVKTMKNPNKHMKKILDTFVTKGSVTKYDKKELNVTDSTERQGIHRALVTLEKEGVIARQGDTLELLVTL